MFGPNGPWDSSLREFIQNARELTSCLSGLRYIYKNQVASRLKGFLFPSIICYWHWLIVLAHHAWNLLIAEYVDVNTRELDAHGKDHSMNYKHMRLTVSILRKQEVSSLTRSQLWMPSATESWPCSETSLISSHSRRLPRLVWPNFCYLFNRLCW